MDQVMRSAGMLRIALEYFFHERRGTHVRRHVAACVRRAEQSQCVETRRVDIVRIFRVQLFHRERIAPVAIVLLALAEQDFAGSEISLLARSLRLRCASFRRGIELRECRARSDRVLLLPDRVVVRHRLAPVCERELGIGGLCALESSRSEWILEVVKRGDARQKICLSGGRTGVLERDDAHVRRGGLQRQPRDERRNCGDAGNDGPKFHLRLRYPVTAMIECDPCVLNVYLRS
jgi:hypothetical protein